MGSSRKVCCGLSLPCAPLVVPAPHTPPGPSAVHPVSIPASTAEKHAALLRHHAGSLPHPPARGARGRRGRHAAAHGRRTVVLRRKDRQRGMCSSGPCVVRVVSVLTMQSCMSVGMDVISLPAQGGRSARLPFRRVSRGLGVRPTIAGLWSFPFRPSSRYRIARRSPRRSARWPRALSLYGESAEGRDSREQPTEIREE